MLRRLTTDSGRHNSLVEGCNPIYFCFVTLKEQQKHKQINKPIKTIVMKLFLFALTAFLSFSSLKSNAQNIKVSASVMSAFQSSFGNATDVKWKDGGNYYKADFTMNGQYVTAFYDATANLIGVTKNISPVQLPITLQTSLKKSYEDYWVSDLFELSGENGTSYYVTVEDGDSKITLKSVGNTWMTYKKQRKS